jgi:hypothetical protein
MAQLDPLTGQTVPLLPSPADEEQVHLVPELTPLERRRGRRRAEAEAEIPAERRQYDRRKRTPGLPALLGAILGDDEEQTPEA